MHLDNNKSNNVVSNLKWGTISENTKQAVQDGLIKNHKGFDDDQSIPCDCYETTTNKLIASYGSISLAANATGISKSTISKQMIFDAEPIRKKIYFVKYNSGPRIHDIVIEYDYNTDIEINRFCNISKAAIERNVSDSTISQQIYNNKKPKYRPKSGTYFLRKTI